MTAKRRRRAKSNLSEHAWVDDNGDLRYELREAADDTEEFLYGDPLAEKRAIERSTLGMYRWKPPDNRRIPKAGGWAMMVKRVAVEEPFGRKLALGRVFYVQHLNNTDKYGFAPDGSYSVLCRSPWGDCRLWPWEYLVLATETITEWWQLKHLTFHPMADFATATVTDRMFYCMSRGINRADAMVMALGTVVGPVGWFHPDRHITEACRLFQHVGEGIRYCDHHQADPAQPTKEGWCDVTTT